MHRPATTAATHVAFTQLSAPQQLELVKALIAQIPAGKVATYGDLAEELGTGPRQVGAFMSRHGNDVAWWRVVNASGKVPQYLYQRALDRWKAEGTALTKSLSGVKMAKARIGN